MVHISRRSQRFRMAPTALVIVGLAAFMLPSIVAAASYEIDGIHSTLIFRAKRMGTVYVYGRFNDVSGSIDIPGDDLGSGKVMIEVKTASVDSGNERRDNHLRSPDFLNATELPLMTFESTKVTKTGADTLDVLGKLSLHGVTKEVTIPMERVGSGKDPRSGASLIGFDGSFSLKRSDFSMAFMQGPIGDQIDIRIAIHGVAK
ncbi:MAG: YceI family protein [Acidobacteriota bacterium]|nr:YceI family protein [Acidobacteriota bacterium]